MEIFKNIYLAIWSENIWLPPNITWNDVKTGSKAWHMFIPLILGIILTIFRFYLEKFVFASFGKFLGIKDKRPKPPPYNEVLEKHYKINRRLHLGMALSLSKQTDMTEREIEFWWMMRRAQDKPTILNKFNEACFKAFFYTLNFYYGLIILWKKDYFWNFDELFRDYPHQSLDNDVWWLYIFATSLYWSLFITLFYEARRLDFYQMLLHHFLVVLLFNLCFICNMHRIFHIFSVLHDVVEYLLYIVKVGIYSKYKRTAQLLFITFAILWTVTRLFIYPFMWYRFIFHVPFMFFKAFPMYYVVAVILLTFQCLHIFWTYIIYKVLYEAFKRNEGEIEDIRSSEDEIGEKD